MCEDAGGKGDLGSYWMESCSRNGRRVTFFPGRWPSSSGDFLGQTESTSTTLSRITHYLTSMGISYIGERGAIYISVSYLGNDSGAVVGRWWVEFGTD